MAQGKIDDPERERERGRKISEARKRKFQEQGYLNSAEARQKISEAQQGRVLSEETKRKVSQAMKGKTPKNFGMAQALAHAASRERSGQDIANWKGDDVGYDALQAWVRRYKGNATRCEQCGTMEASTYHWVSKSGERQRDLEDWIRLCISCHWTQLKRIPWNKDQKTGPNLKARGPRESYANSGQFQQGQEPQNKGQKMPSYSGEKHPNWKGGITEANHAIRSSLEYKLWRRTVFERDHFTCTLCGYRSSYHGRGKCDIRADHIQPFHAFPELRFVVANGRTLCISCDLQHGWQPWRKEVGNAQLLGVEGKET